MYEMIVSVLLESENFWSAAIGATFGAVVSAAVSGWISNRLQKRNFDEARKMREEEKLERDRALATAAFLKMGHFHMVFTHMEKHFGKAIDQAGSERNSNICQFIHVMANLPSRESLTYKELGLVLRFVSDKSFGLILNMNNQFTSLLDVVSVFNDDLFEMRKLIQSPDVKFLDIFENERPQVELKNDELNGMINSIYDAASEGVIDAAKIMTDFEKTLNPAFKLNLRFKGGDNKVSEEAPQQDGG